MLVLITILIILWLLQYMKNEEGIFFSRGSFITLINFRAQTQGAQTRYSAECMLSCHVRVLE